jgi:hypothetical protein
MTKTAIREVVIKHGKKYLSYLFSSRQAVILQICEESQQLFLARVAACSQSEGHKATTSSLVYPSLIGRIKKKIFSLLSLKELTFSSCLKSPPSR